MTDSRPLHRMDQPGVLDAAIDRAVQDLMTAEPRPGLRHRVLARLGRPRAGRRALPSFALGVAAVAVLIVAVTLLRPSGPAPLPPATQVPQTAVARPPAPSAPEVSTAQRPEAADAAAKAAEARITRVPIEMPRVTNVFGERTARAEAAAALGEDVVFADPTAAYQEVFANAPSAIVITGIEISPLHVSPIVVEPLPAPSLKDAR